MSFKTAVKSFDTFDANLFAIKHLKLPLVAVGSRVTYSGKPKETSDYDYLARFFSEEELNNTITELVRLNWNTNSRLYPNPSNNMRFVSLKKGYVNLILTDDVNFYNKFLLATETAKKLNLATREERVILFQAILYGV